MNKRSVFLVGMMGAGKTRCGRRLASKLDLPFTDMDYALEAEHGKTVSQLFSSVGEDGYRRMEHEWLINFVQQNQPAVVSTGGGAPCFYDNMDLMNSHGITVWLNPPLEELIERLWRNKDERPKIAAVANKDDLRQYISQLLEVRNVYYSKSKIVAGEAPPDLAWLVQAIMQLE